jgi:hypothetical protein
MGAPSAIEAGFGEFKMPSGARVPPRPAGLQLVTAPVRLSQAPAGRTGSGASLPAASRTGRPARPETASSEPASPKPVSANAPLRLTRRGRAVVVVFAVIVATVVITLIGMAVAGGAQAANHGRAGAGYQGMRQIVVRPGETLWTIAARAEPSADPRLVISQIMTANLLSTTVVQAGELLWVPK